MKNAREKEFRVSKANFKRTMGLRITVKRLKEKICRKDKSQECQAKYLRNSLAAQVLGERMSYMKIA